MKKTTRKSNKDVYKHNTEQEHSSKEQFKKDIEKIGQNVILEVAKEMSKMKEHEVAAFQQLLLNESKRYSQEMERRFFEDFTKGLFTDTAKTKTVTKQKRDSFIHQLTREAFISLLESMKNL